MENFGHYQGFSTLKYMKQKFMSYILFEVEFDDW